MTTLFLLFAVTAAVLLFAHRGEFPLPAAWELALAGVTTSFTLRVESAQLLRFLVKQEELGWFECDGDFRVHNQTQLR
jgi:hypothetical protein